MVQAHRDAEIQWAVASSGTLVALARAQVPDLLTYAIPSWAILKTAGYRRHLYAASLFEHSAANQAMAGEGPLAGLASELEVINRAFEPDLVIATSQSVMLPLIFSRARCLWMEQAPFPRRKAQGRVYFDPCGHQICSVLEQATEQIRSLNVNPSCQASALELWQSMLDPVGEDQAAAHHVREAARKRVGNQRVALLVLQPPDWLSWEGCLGGPTPPESVLAQWASELPEGWVGIPLYHPDARIPTALEGSLAAEYPQLAPLPAELSGNVAEWLLPLADAVVTVSSSVAAQALISGKQVVVSRRSPLRHLAATSLEALRTPSPSLTPQERPALLAFLSHRYTLTLAEIADPSGPFPGHLRSLLQSPDPVEWLLDHSDWPPARLARLV